MANRISHVITVIPKPIERDEAVLLLLGPDSLGAGGFGMVVVLSNSIAKCVSAVDVFNVRRLVHFWRSKAG